MASLFVKVTIKPGKLTEFENVCRALEKETKKEKGCLQYSYWRSQKERSYYCILEFSSYRDFLIHQTSEHHEKLITPRVDELFEAFETEWLDPVEGASQGIPTEHQPANHADSDLIKFYAERMPAIKALWWDALRSK